MKDDILRQGDGSTEDIPLIFSVSGVHDLEDLKINENDELYGYFENSTEIWGGSNDINLHDNILIGSITGDQYNGSDTVWRLQCNLSIDDSDCSSLLLL